MGQVPARVLIVGNGRLATTLWNVLQAPDFPFARAITSIRWTRASKSSLGDTLAAIDASHVWLAISDHALRAFVHEHNLVLKDRIVVHFAGSLSGWPGVHAAHPLTTFNGSTNGSASQSYAWFSKIPFVLDAGGLSFEELMPGFENPSYQLEPAKRAYYHALCVTAGNFSVLLWETVAARFENELNLQPEALAVFRHQVFRNLEEAKKNTSVLTGPLLRGDLETMNSNRSALLAHFEIPLLKIYDAFSDLFRTERTRRENRT